MESSYPSGGIDFTTSVFGAADAASTSPPVIVISLGAGMSIGAAAKAHAAQNTVKIDNVYRCFISRFSLFCCLPVQMALFSLKS